ncbi:MAG: hypothetical protein L0221_14320, partial [Chloroflexi bacterium]|nr:hypothetical protein [Chloroflexota bacterium]
GASAPLDRLKRDPGSALSADVLGQTSDRVTATGGATVILPSRAAGPVRIRGVIAGVRRH